MPKSLYYLGRMHFDIIIGNATYEANVLFVVGVGLIREAHAIDIMVETKACVKKCHIKKWGVAELII